MVLIGLSSMLIMRIDKKHPHIEPVDISLDEIDNQLYVSGNSDEIVNPNVNCNEIR